MRTFTVYRNGASACTVSGYTGGDVGKRGQIGGWSPAAARRNRQFLYSVQHELCDGFGFALSLTLRDCPATPSEFHALRRAWLERVRRLGALRWHWVIEMQRRRVPHLHAAVYFPCDPGGFGRFGGWHSVQAWLAIASEYGARISGQHVDLIDDSVGWAMYLDKHAARGVRHYQRSAGSLPAQWRLRSGRLWGRGGDWPVQEPMKFELSDSGWYRLRRLVRSWVESRARVSSKDRGRRIRFARGLLRVTDPELSAVRGVSEWIPDGQALHLLRALAAMGYEVNQ